MNDICDFIALDDGDAAERFFYSVVELAQSTVDQPEVGRVVPEYNRKDVRERIHKRYQVRIVYWLRLDTIMDSRPGGFANRSEKILAECTKQVSRD